LRITAIQKNDCPERNKIVVFVDTEVANPTITAPMRYRLFYAPDNASLIVRMALDELGQAYETILVDRAQNGHKHPDYLKFNPAGKIPTLLIDDEPIFETAAILLWLADKHGAMAPVQNDPKRAAFLKWLFFMSNTMHADFRLLVYAHKYTSDSGCDDLRTGAQTRMAQGFAMLNAALNEWSGNEMSPSIMDYYVVTLMRWCTLYPSKDQTWFDRKHYSNLDTLSKVIESRPAVQVAIRAEGLNQTPFSLPDYANPPEGSAI
jgi:glutathione S-transferase